VYIGVGGTALSSTAPGLSTRGALERFPHAQRLGPL